MFKTIFKKELIDQLISPKFLIVFLLCLILIPPSLVMNYKNYRNNLFEYEYLKRDYNERKKIVNLPLTAHREPSILSTFGIGLERVLPKVIIFKKYHTETQTTQAEHELLSNITGKMDFVLIVSFLLGLFAILYASALIVGEKETGTLKLVLSNKTKRSAFLFGKYMAGYIVLVIPLFISFLISILFLAFSGFPLFSADNFSHILVLLILSLIYLSTFFALGLFISTRSQKTSVAFILSFLIWILLAVVVPKISEPLANIIHPIQSDEVRMMKRRQVRDQIELEKGAKLAPLAQKYIWGREGARDFNKYREERAPIASEFEGRIERALQELDAQSQKEKDFNVNLSLLIARLSPSLIYTHSSLNFCNTGLADRENFFRNLMTYHNQLSTVYFKNTYDDIIVSEDGKSKSHISGRSSSESEIPEFQYEFLILGETLKSSLPDILLLILYNLILFSAAYFSFVRYDVR